jgi:glutamate/tyrosine decarboxylase-like PLP-dependent enzyme
MQSGNVGTAAISDLEEGLDPHDWNAMRELGHRMVDDLFGWLQNVRQRPAWQPIPSSVRQQFRRPLPQLPQAAEQIYQEFLENVLPYPTGNIHPRFWAFVMGSGTPLGMLAELLAAGMNCNTWGGDQIGIEVETQVLDWCKQIFGFPAEASGILTDGGSMANLIGLTVARNSQAEFDVASEGLRGAARKMMVYSSAEAHSCFLKGVELLGLGASSLRRIPVDASFAINLEALRDAIEQDRTLGYQPFCIIGNAGTVNSGAFDDLSALADLCQDEGLWFHVDGAFGAYAAMSPSLRDKIKGMERADSLAVSLHKWLHVQYDAGCVLIRRPIEHRRTFHRESSYMVNVDRGLAGGHTWFNQYGFELSRNFRALKVWMSIKEHGTEKFGMLVEQNVAQAQYLAELVKAAPELELLAPVSLNIVCFRYVRPGATDAELDALNRDILGRLHEDGIAVPSYTTLHGKFAIRVAITNHRSRREDFECLVREVRRLGAELGPA